MNNIHSLFSEPIATYTLDRAFTKSEKDALINQNWKDSYGNLGSVDTNVLSKTNLESVREFLNEAVLDFANQVYDFEEKNTELYITQSWMNKTTPGGYHNKHNHPNSIVSGTFYIETNENDVIEFFKPGIETAAWNFPTNEWNTWNSETWKMPVSSGQLLLWRSSLPHSVPTMKGPNNRYSLAFNTFVRGTIGLVPLDSELSADAQISLK